jgi:ligand-binding sensor domain-containing protein
MSISIKTLKVFNLLLTRIVSFLIFVLLIAFKANCQEEPHLSPIPFFTNFDTGANVRALAMEDETLWIGLSNGIIRYETGAKNTKESYEIYTVRSTHNRFLSNGIFKIKIDEKKNKWFATYGGGLVEYNGSAWKVFTPYGMGTTDYGKNWTQFKEGEGLGDLWAYDVHFTKEKMWVATWKGASLFDGNSFKTYTTKEGLPDKWVYAIGEEKDGSLWFGTEGGVSHFKDSRWTNYNHQDGLGAEIKDPVLSPHEEGNSYHHSASGKLIMASNPNYVLTLIIDSENNKWFGTWGGGVSKYDGKSWKNYSQADGLGGNFVNALAFDSKGNLWAGTNGGASYFDGKIWRNVSEKEGLLNNNVFAIAFDKEGNKYFGTWKGLSKMEHYP